MEEKSNFSNQSEKHKSLLLFHVLNMFYDSFGFAKMFLVTKLRQESNL